MTAPSRNGWTRCPPGVFARLSANLTARQQRRVWLTRLLWAAGLLAALGASLGAATAIDAWQSGAWNRPKPQVAPCAPADGQPAAQPADAPMQAPGCSR
jgi:hypothetical protein